MHVCSKVPLKPRRAWSYLLESSRLPYSHGQIPTATLEDLSPLLDTLQEHSNTVGLSGIEIYKTITPITLPSHPHYPNPWHNRDAESLGLPDLQVHCVKFLTAATLTEAQAEEIEAQTRSQHMTPAWFRWRAGRIRASVMHAVFATSLDTPAQSVVNRVWGIKHEEDARKAYTEIMAAHHHKLQVRLCGFCGCLEIKCPFKQALAQDKAFCSEVAVNGLQLKRAHPYYSQVQTQIFVTGASHCDLVVWTQRDCAVIRIFPDVDFWEPRLKQAQDFFQKVCLALHAGVLRNHPTLTKRATCILI
uniref:YqaJ viral recombinase domain-containing protein n=1 Tax=Pundamilia nyererei TaxID=303518 RepID=A0A3B4EZV7_9CICH